MAGLGRLFFFQGVGAIPIGARRLCLEMGDAFEIHLAEKIFAVQGLED